MSDEVPSIHEANRMVRVLTGERKKYTHRIHNPDGTVLEFQHDKGVKLDYSVESRSLWIFTSDYPCGPVCEHKPGMVILSEENPKV